MVIDRQTLTFKGGESNISKHPKKEQKTPIKTYLTLGFGCGCLGLVFLRRKRGWVA